MMHRQAAEGRFFGMLRTAPWFNDAVRRYFGEDSRQVYHRFFTELIDRGVLQETDGVLTTSVPP